MFLNSTHDVFEELMCNVLYHKVPYLVLRDSSKVKAEIGIKRLLALGLTKEDFSDSLLKYSSRCLIEIPWLVDHSWVPLSKKQGK